ncbi:hypothetical protein SPI_00077 [Niveomyces insectorum RCEF 264]|uniref:BTB domain-containing protein n=1 Tax=Niveomyces insectorum RCEF 264 TaxID=1081102 RepID=A0A162JEU3_9HYPO|nr:hypothetical protein SPI_00077 [Niveomyces insectorum RCEF 264]
MVSQTDRRDISSSLALRGASSLVGSSSSSGANSNSNSISNSRALPPPAPAASVAGSASYSARARRYNRSHVGGSSSASSPYAVLNEFPIFTNTGDVEIVVRVRSGHENRYLLHRDTLARCSGFFEASTSKEWSRAHVVGEEGGRQGGCETDGQPNQESAHALTNGDELARLGEGHGQRSSSEKDARTGSRGSAGNGAEVRQRWRYELDLGQDENDKPILVQKDEDSGSNGGTAVPGATAAQSIFGGAPASLGSTNYSSNTASYRGGKAAPTHSNHSFFRSVANLALPHHHTSSSRHHHHSGSRHGYGNPLYSAAPLLPPPTPEDVDILRDYDNLFRIMYNYPPVLDGINIADAYVQCKSLLAVADEYDALAVVGPRVDHHLLQFQSRLWRQITKYPISYLRLGYLARSRVIFQEALVHVVGQWPAGERSLRAAMPDAVLDLIEDKVDELAEAVSRVEARLFRLHLTTRSGERVTPSTAYLDWLAVSLFRQWLADNTTPAAAGPGGGGGADDSRVVIPERRGAGATGDRYGHSSHHQRNGGGIHRGGHGRSAGHVPASSSSSSLSSSSGGAGRHNHHHHQHHHQHETALMLHVRTAAIPPLIPPLASLGRTYRILGTAAGPAFLGHDECKRFLKLSQELYSRDNLRRFEKRIDELKAMAREVVRPLMGSGLELDVAGGKSGVGSSSGGGNGPGEGITYFTCTYVSDRDLPWLIDGL